MKKLLFIILGICIFSACTQEVKVAQKNFGAKVDSTGAIEVSQLINEMGNSPSLETKLRGKIVEVCQEMGCWLTMDLGNGEILKVNFHDQGFTIPKDSKGKEVIVDGTIGYTGLADNSKEKTELVMEAKGILFMN